MRPSVFSYSSGEAVAYEKPRNMSLHTDIAFKAAIMSDADLLAIVTPSPTPAQPHPKPRIYNSAIPVPDENLDNVPVPYIIVMYNGMTNDAGTKDDYEGDTDTVQIGIEVAAKTREQLGVIMRRIRKIIHEDFMFVWGYADLRDTNDVQLEDTNGFRLRVMREYDEIVNRIPYSYTVSAQAVQYDPWKPCFWQVLNYQCDIANDFDDE